MRTSWFRPLAGVALALLFARCGGGGGGGPAPAPAFFFSAIDPPDGAGAVDPAARIRLTMSEPVDVSSMRPDSVRVGLFGAGGALGIASLVAGTGNRVIELAPLEPLAGGTQYAVLVSGALASTSGHAIGGTLQFAFRTRTGSGGGGVVPPPPSQLQATVGRLRQGRRSHTATGLDDGRVLLCGGYVAGTTVTDKGELFDPGTTTFSLIADRMAAPRAGHAAAKLRDGRVLLCGGFYEASVGSLNATAGAELYDPATDTFTEVAPMNESRVDHAATLLPDGRVLVTGGSRLFGANLLDLSSVEIYDPARDAWSRAPHDLVHTHATHAVVDLLDGRWFIAGGSDSDLRPELYTFAGETFTAIAPATGDTGRFGAAVARYADGRVTIVGGEAQGQVLVFSPATSTLGNSGSPTSVPRAYATVSPIGPGRMLVAGGIDYTGGNYVEPSCDLLVEGGITGSSTFATSVRFPTGMAFHTATVLGDGRILFAGGINSTAGQPEFDGAYLFTP